MPIGMMDSPKAMLTATPAANGQETARGAATDARPALVGKKYIARTEMGGFPPFSIMAR